MRSPAFVAFLLGYMLLVGAHTAGFGWVWDDRPLVQEAALSPVGEALGTAWTSDFWALAPEGDRFSSGMYRPVVTSTYVLERALGVGPGGAHLVNLVLHVGVALAAGWLAMGIGFSGPWTAALVVLHPHAAGLLGNVAGRTDLLATLGVVLALGCQVRGRLGWGALALLLACLSKETALAGALLWCIWAIPKEGLRGARVPGAVLLSVLVLRTICVGAPPPSQLEGAGGILMGLSSTGWAFFDLVVPLDAGPWPVPHALLPGLFWMLLAAVAVRWAHTGLIWVLVTWALMAGWVGLDVRHARALLYLPAIGLALVVGQGMLNRSRRVQGVAVALGGLLLGMQHQALSHWKTPESLWMFGVEKNPTDPLPQVNLGRVHAEAGRHDAAVVHYTNAASLAKAQEDATFFVKAAGSLGQLALLDGDLERARVYFEDAVSIAGQGGAPGSEEALRNLPSALPAVPSTPEPDSQEQEPTNPGRSGD
jgi:hypothetical protein